MLVCGLLLTARDLVLYRTEDNKLKHKNLFVDKRDKRQKDNNYNLNQSHINGILALIRDFNSEVKNR